MMPPLPAQLEGDLHFDPLVLRNPGEVDVQDVLSVDVPLQGADERLLAEGAVQLDDASAVAQHGGHGIGLHAQVLVRFAVAVEHRRNVAAAAQAPRVAGALGVAQGYVQ